MTIVGFRKFFRTLLGGYYHNFIRSSIKLSLCFSAAEEKFPRSDTPDILDELSTDNQQSNNVVVLEETAGMSSVGEQQEAAKVEGNFCC